jgi:hypothetical protein
MSAMNIVVVLSECLYKTRYNVGHIVPDSAVYHQLRKFWCN